MGEPHSTENDAASRQQNNGDQQSLAASPKLLQALDHQEPPAAAFTEVEPFADEDMSTSKAAERSGINLGSFPSIETITAKARNLSEKLPASPMGAICSIFAGKTSSGYASNRTFPLWPTCRRGKSCWLACTRTCIAAGLTTCMKVVPGSSWSPS